MPKSKVHFVTPLAMAADLGKGLFRIEVSFVCPKWGKKGEKGKLVISQ